MTKRFEVINPETGEKLVLFNLAKRAKAGNLEDYIEAMLDKKDQFYSELIWIDAFNELEEGRSFQRFETHIRPLQQEEKRSEWRRQYRFRNSVERNLDIISISEIKEKN